MKKETQFTALKTMIISYYYSQPVRITMRKKFQEKNSVSIKEMFENLTNLINSTMPECIVQINQNFAESDIIDEHIKQQYTTDCQKNNIAVKDRVWEVVGRS